jgi:hypothetical protein
MYRQSEVRYRSHGDKIGRSAALPLGFNDKLLKEISLFENLY